ncbi:MAG: exopolysaccharide biosynthesis polyprenyl glycosylphosphotransferase [Polyangiales bacterium]
MNPLLGRNAARLAALDLFLVAASLLLAATLARYGSGVALARDLLTDWTGAVVIAVSVHLLCFYIFELYDLRIDFRRGPGVLRCVAAVSVAAVALAVASFLAPKWSFGRLIFGLDALILTALVAASRALASRSFAQRVPPRPTLLVTAGPVPTDVLDELASSPESPFEIIGSLPLARAKPAPLGESPRRTSTPPPIASLDDVNAVIERHACRDVIVVGASTLPLDALRTLLAMKHRGVHVHDLAVVYQSLSGRIPLELVDDVYFLRQSAFTRDVRPFLSNALRVLDVVVAVALLALSFPLWVIATLGIKLTMPGPVFFSQERVGKGGVTYMVHKFRSMGVDAEREGPRWATQGDPRVTPFGRFLRRTRVDELPQLWNVLRGDMSLVGPRPERPIFVEQLEGELPHYDLRALIRPGLTGWAQVNYRYGSSVDDARIKLSYDLYYIQERSVSLFALTLLKTVSTVLLKPGS